MGRGSCHIGRGKNEEIEIVRETSADVAPMAEKTERTLRVERGASGRSGNRYVETVQIIARPGW